MICWNSISVSQKFIVDNNIVVMRYIACACAQATVKMEPDRKIESSETEMETDRETFKRDASAVPEDHLVKKQNAKAAVWRYFGLETESGMVKDPELPVCRVCHVHVKTKQPFEKASPDLSTRQLGVNVTIREKERPCRV